MTIIGSQTGANAACGKLYPARMRTSGLGWALGVGRIGAIAGPLIGGPLIGRLPLRELFLIAAVPMAVGAVAAVLVTWRCFIRLGGLRLGDVPVPAVSAGGARPAGAMAQLPAEE